MADVTMCMSRACPSRLECYRHEAPANASGQQYADFESVRNFEIRCAHFRPIKPQSDSVKGKLIGGGE